MTTPRDHLHSALLGEFDPAGRVRIWPTEHDSEASVELTRLHEDAHRLLASTTTFGVMQRLLGWARATAVAEPWLSSEEAERLLGETIEASFTTHETWALHCERRGIWLHGLPAVAAPSYPQAEDALRDLRVAFADRPAPLEHYMLRAAIEAAMNIPISACGSLIVAVVDNVLRSPALRPDERLRGLIQSLAAAGGLRAATIERLYAVAGTLRDEFRLPVRDLDVAIVECWRRPDALWEPFRRSFVAAASEILDAEMLRHMGTSPTLTVADAASEIEAFWQASAAQATEQGVKIPGLVMVTGTTTPWPLASIQHDVDFVPPAWFDGVSVVVDAPPELLAKAFLESDLHYVAWLDAVAVRLLPLEPSSGQASDPADVESDAASRRGDGALQLRPTGERLAFALEPQDQRTLVEALDERLLATVVEARVEATSLGMGITVASAMSCIDPDRMGVCWVDSSRVSTAVTLLDVVRGLGVERLYRVFSGVREAWVCAVVEEALLLFRVPHEVPGMLAAHDPGAHQWWAGAVSEDREPRLQPAYLVAVLDRLGGFAAPR